jgi:hypothetical protein
LQAADRQYAQSASTHMNLITIKKYKCAKGIRLQGVYFT